jgi:NADH-quinone oxidoreductase subunit K
LDDLLGQFYVLCILAVSAAEAAIGLAILVIFFRLRGGISLDLINVLKG